MMGLLLTGKGQGRSGPGMDAFYFHFFIFVCVRKGLPLTLLSGGRKKIRLGKKVVEVIYLFYFSWSEELDAVGDAGTSVRPYAWCMARYPNPQSQRGEIGGALGNFSASSLRERRCGF